MFDGSVTASNIAHVSHVQLLATVYSSTDYWVAMNVALFISKL